MSSVIPPINDFVEDNAGVVGALAAISHEKHNKQMNQIARENLKLRRENRELLEKQYAEALKSREIEQNRLQYESLRFKIEEEKRQEEQIMKEEKHNLELRQKNARISLTSINREIDILENSLAV